MILKRLFWIFFSFCVAISIFVVTFLFKFSSDDLLYYKKYLKRRSRYLQSSNLKTYTSCQDRKKVQKDIWVSGETFRPHLRITSDNSKLILIQTKGKTDLVEELQNIECWMQDKIDTSTNTQHVRHFQAEEGTYDFISHHFLAKEINLDFFHFPGILLPNQFPTHQSYLNGTATELTFSFRNRIPFISASHLSAEITMESEL